MELGILAHIVHSLILVAVYILLGTIYLPGLIQRLDIPLKTRDIFRASCFVFLNFCAYTHTELIIHIKDLPADYFTWAHNITGFIQALGAIGVVAVLHPLIFKKRG